jgi:hypothetical protein
MISAVRRHLTYANVMASIAVFVAMSGGAYALSLPKKSVGSKQLRTGAVTNKKIKKNAVTGSKVKADALTGSDVNESKLGKVPSATTADTATTATTATNATKLNNKDAAAYPSSLVIRRKDLTPLANGSSSGALGDGSANDGTIYCAAGEHAIGGGVRIAAAGVDQAVSSSRPVKDTSSSASVPDDGGTALGWRGVASDSGGVAGNNPSDVQVYVYCAS